MDDEHSKYEEAATIRFHYNQALEEACKLYYESEEVAAHLSLEIFRLENLKSTSEPEERERLERLSEKEGVFSRTKETLRFILDKLHELARDRDRFVSDIYTSTQIIDVESELDNLTPWLQDLWTEVGSRADTAKLDAKIASEISRVKAPSLR
ncbi:MAG: hypothetical protein WBG50_02895 [Desulfomonilaceae bacterium]